MLSESGSPHVAGRRQGKVTSPGCAAASALVVWILHAIFGGGRGGIERARKKESAGSELFFYFLLRCLFENTAAQFCCCVCRRVQGQNTATRR